MKRILSSLLIYLISSTIFAATWYVKPDESSTAWENQDPANVKLSFKDAFIAAAANDEIWMAAGTYEVSEVTAFNKHLKVYGGFLGTETVIADRVRVANGNAWDFENITIIQPKMGVGAYAGAFMTVPSGQTVIVSGITFQQFRVAPLGIRQNTTIEECILANNTSAADGAGITMYPGGNAKRCYFYKNKAKTSAGIFVNLLNQSATVDKCLFEENIAEWGVAINVKHSLSGGLPHDVTKLCTVTDCIMKNNTGTAGANGIMTLNSEAAMAANCLIANNNGLALQIAGGQFSNGTIVNNIGNESSVLITNKGMVNVDQPTKLYNTVIWNNHKDLETPASAGITIEAGQIAAIANVACDVVAPAAVDFILLDVANIGTEKELKYAEFITPTEFVGGSIDEEAIAAIRTANWAVKGTSAIIDKGNNAFIYGSIVKDLVGNDRFLDTCIDLGAYETLKVATGLESNLLQSAAILAVEGGVEVTTDGGVLYIRNVAGQTVKMQPIQSGTTFVPVALKGVCLIQLLSHGGESSTAKIYLN